jgi:hypothetical protein
MPNLMLLTDGNHLSNDKLIGGDTEITTINNI